MSRLLLSYGADVNAPPAAYNGRTAVQGAAESGKWKILSMLQGAGAQINAPAGEKLGMTALQAACSNGHTLMARYLLARGAHLDAAPSTLAGLTSIQAAATHGDIGLVRDLISLGAKADAPATELSTTALMAATKHKSLPLLELLVLHGGTINPTGDYALQSPLGEAVACMWLKGVEYLLEHGANINRPSIELVTRGHLMWDQELVSPLGWAIANGSEEMEDVLNDIFSPAGEGPFVETDEFVGRKVVKDWMADAVGFAAALH
ncbi:ankyrin repeat-containing domain protein [Aspergillus spectabilis]